MALTEVLQQATKMPARKLSADHIGQPIAVETEAAVFVGQLKVLFISAASYQPSGISIHLSVENKSTTASVPPLDGDEEVYVVVKPVIR